MAEETATNNANSEGQESAENSTPKDESQASKEQKDKAPNEMTLETAQAQIDKLRKEAARYRNERNELKSDAEAWREKQESEKTEMQRLQERVEASERELESERTQRLKLDVANEYGIKQADLDLLGSGDRETLAARAERLAALYENEKSAGKPPSDRPSEGLRSGSGATNESPDYAYPSDWI